MRLFVSLSALLISATLLVVYSNSFTTAEVKNETKLSITSEENALIAITYTKGKKFELRNNTDKKITIHGIELLGDTKNEILHVHVPFTLHPGVSQEFNITADPKKLTGKVIVVKADWNGGSAEIKSTIPNLKENQTTSDLNAEQIDTELDSENIIPETIEEQSDLEVDDGLEVDSELEEGDVE